MAKGFAIAAGVSVTSLVIAGVLFSTVMAPSNRFEACNVAAVASNDMGGPFTLINAQGQTVTDTDVITEPSLLYFGYTFCPDVCPLDVVRNAEAVDIMAEQGVSVQPVFISVDPERDTPEVVGDFAANMHPKMVGLTGSDDQVSAASKAYKTFYQKQDGDPDYYLVNHSTFSYLVLPDEGFVQFFSRELRPDQMADQIMCVLENV